MWIWITVLFYRLRGYFFWQWKTMLSKNEEYYKLCCNCCTNSIMTILKQFRVFLLLEHKCTVAMGSLWWACANWRLTLPRSSVELNKLLIINDCRSVLCDCPLKNSFARSGPMNPRKIYMITVIMIKRSLIKKTNQLSRSINNWFTPESKPH